MNHLNEHYPMIIERDACHFFHIRCFFCFRYSNELLGLEGMVKIKNPDENLLNGNHTISITGDSDVKISHNDITDSKRFLA